MHINIDTDPTPQLDIDQERYTRRITFGLSIGGSTYNSKSRFFLSSFWKSTLHYYSTCLCDGITTRHPTAIDKHTGLAWSQRVANQLPVVFEEMIREMKTTPLFTFENQSPFNTSHIYTINMLKLFVPKNSAAETMIKYPDFFLNDNGLIPYLTMDGYMDKYEIVPGTEGYCLVPINFTPNRDINYQEADNNKIEVDGITDSKGYVDYGKIAEATREELLNNPEKYINYIFPHDKRSLAIITLLQALEKVTSDFIQEFSEQYPNIPGSTTVTGALETNDEILIFGIGDSRTAVTFDGTLIALTKKHAGLGGITSVIGGCNGQIYTNQAENISILRIPKNTLPPDNLCNLQLLIITIHLWNG